MLTNHDEYVELRDQLQSEFDGRYKQINECEKTVEKEDEKIEKIFNDITQMRQDFSLLRIERAKDSTKLSIVIAILCAIAVPLVSVCIKLLVLDRLKNIIYTCIA